MIVPQPLLPGDKIAIISPASHIKEQYIDGAVNALISKGYVPVVFPHARGKYGTYSGIISDRFADIKAAFEDDDIKAILCSRGGYGVVHLIAELPDYFLRSHPKWLIGFSDITALHSTLVTAGVCSIHASMCKHLATIGTEDASSTALFNILKGNAPHYTFPSHHYNIAGKAVGQIVGGNMAVMCAMIGSNQCFLKPDTILFIEDIGEAVYKIERMLYQLQLAGILSNLRGLIVGRFTEYQKDEQNNLDMYDMIHNIVQHYTFPIAFDIPIGHIDNNTPIIEGATASLSVDTEATTLHFQ